MASRYLNIMKYIVCKSEISKYYQVNNYSSQRRYTGSLFYSATAQWSETSIWLIQRLDSNMPLLFLNIIGNKIFQIKHKKSQVTQKLLDYSRYRGQQFDDGCMLKIC